MITTSYEFTINSAEMKIELATSDTISSDKLAIYNQVKESPFIQDNPQYAINNILDIIKSYAINKVKNNVPRNIIEENVKNILELINIYVVPFDVNIYTDLIMLDCTFNDNFDNRLTLMDSIFERINQINNVVFECAFLLVYLRLHLVTGDDIKKIQNITSILKSKIDYRDEVIDILNTL
jgi:hypothetical protein